MKRDNSGISGDLDDHPLSSAYEGDGGESILKFVLGLFAVGIGLAIFVAIAAYVILPVASKLLGLE